MSSKASIEIVRRVFDDENGVCMEVGPWPDAPDSALALMVRGDENREWFGPLDLSMSPEFAKKLGEALVSAADEFMAKKA